MTSQRPAWFRFRPAAPAPTPTPAPIRPPPPAVVRPTIPIRPPPPPTQSQQQPPPPPAPAAAPPQPPRSPVAPPTAAPRSPVTTPAAPRRSPVTLSPPVVAPPRAPLRAPVVPPNPQPFRPRSLQRSPPVQLTPQPSPPKTPPRSPFVPPPHPPTASPARQSAPPPAATSPPLVPISSPKTKTQAQSSSKTTSPVANAATIGTVNGKNATPLSSPNIVKPMGTTQIQSPNTIKPLSRDPSPFTLPPAQIDPEKEREPKLEQKSVLVQETIEKPMKIMPNAQNNGIAPNGKREATIKDKGANKKTSDSEEEGMRMITLAGENRGAVMELSPSHKKVYSLGNPQTLENNKNTKTWSYNGDQQSGEEGKSNDKDKNNRAMSMQSPAMSAILNSNVQGVNNSILYNIDCRQNDPGVHLSLTRKANGDRQARS